MTTFAPPRITPDDLLRIPDSQSMELVDGQIVEKNVSVLSSDFEGSIITVLRTEAMKRGAKAFPASLGYQCFPETPDRVRKPDATVITAARFATLNAPNPGYMPIVPDLAVEVISTNDRAYEIDEKLLEYRSAGFPLVWIVHPISRTIDVIPIAGQAYILNENDDIRCENALPGFVCKVSDLFPPRI